MNPCKIGEFSRPGWWVQITKPPLQAIDQTFHMGHITASSTRLLEAWDKNSKLNECELAMPHKRQGAQAWTTKSIQQNVGDEECTARRLGWTLLEVCDLVSVWRTVPRHFSHRTEREVLPVEGMHIFHKTTMGRSEAMQEWGEGSNSGWSERQLLNGSGWMCAEWWWQWFSMTMLKDDSMMGTTCLGYIGPAHCLCVWLIVVACSPVFRLASDHCNQWTIKACSNCVSLSVLCVSAKVPAVSECQSNWEATPMWATCRGVYLLRCSLADHTVFT